MRDFEIDGYEISAPTREAAIAEYVELFGTQPETVEEVSAPDPWDEWEARDMQADYDDQWGDPLDMPSYAS